MVVSQKVLLWLVSVVYKICIYFKKLEKKNRLKIEIHTLGT